MEGNQKLNRPTTASTSLTERALPTLPEDLINEILLRTPTKSLVRFKCVAKSWLLRTLEKKFIASHLKQTTNNDNDKKLISHVYKCDLVKKTFSEVIAYLGFSGPIKTVLLVDKNKGTISAQRPRKFTLYDYSKEVILAGSINGIVCLMFSGVMCFSNYKEMEGHSVALWNPAINMSKPIRFPDSATDYDMLNFRSVGLGFDKATDDYKIVRIVAVVLPPNFEKYCWSRVEIYSANCDIWTDFQTKGYVPFWPKLPNCNFIIQDCPYWVGAVQQGHIEDRILVSIDPCTGLWKKVRYPEFATSSTVVNPVKWKDSLALLVQDFCHSVDMYVLDESTENWTKIYTTEVYQFNGLRIPQSLATGELVFQTWDMFTEYIHGTPYFCNPETGNISKKGGLASIDPLWYQSYSHVESLVCVKGMEIIGKENNHKKKAKPRKDWTDLLPKDFETLLHLN